MASACELEKCREVRDAVQAVLASRVDERTTAGQRLCLLSAILQNQWAGKQGAGLSLGQFQDMLWKDMLFDRDPRFTEPGEAAEDHDVDYAFMGHPLSHKTIGWNGGGDLALSWSKNPPEGHRRTQFTSDVVIVVTRRPSKRPGIWTGLGNGCFVVPRAWLEENVVLGSNNKTDALIQRKDTTRALRHAMDSDLYVPLAYNHAAGLGQRLSLWKAGAAAIVHEGESH